MVKILVGRGVLSPTLAQITNKLYRSISVIYAYIYLFCNAFDLCRLMSDRGQSDLRLFVMPKWHSKQKHYSLTYFSHKLFFYVKITKKL